MLKVVAVLSTPLVADACVRNDVPLRAAPPGIGVVVPEHRIAGRALPARTTAGWTCSWRRCAGPNRVTGWREQARMIPEGETLLQQTAFDDYLARRAADPSYTFRRHLWRIGGPIEKIGVFFVAFLPGFIPTGAPVAATAGLLGALFVAEPDCGWRC